MTVDKTGHVSRRNILLAGAATATATILPGKVRAQAADIVVGGLLPLTGPNAAWGQRTWRGLQLACEIVNERGGVRALGGAKLRAVSADTESRPEVAASQVERLIQRGVVAVTGCNQSAATIVASQITERAQVPFVSSSDIDPVIVSRKLQYVFLTSPLVGTLARDLILEVRQAAKASNSNPTKLAILSESSITGRTASEVAAKFARENGFEVVAEASYDASTTQNFGSYVTRMKAAGAEVVLGHNKTNDAILITRAMKELSFNPVAYGGIIGGHGSTEYTAALGAAAEGVLATASWSPDLTIPGLKEVAAHYRSKHGEDMDYNVASGLTALSVIWDGLERGGSTKGPALRAAIAKTNLKSGERLYLQLSGARFDPSGENAAASAVVFQIQSGKFVTVAPQGYAIGKVVYPKPRWA